MTASQRRSRTVSPRIGIDRTRHQQRHRKEDCVDLRQRQDGEGVEGAGGRDDSGGGTRKAVHHGMAAVSKVPGVESRISMMVTSGNDKRTLKNTTWKAEYAAAKDLDDDVVAGENRKAAQAPR